MLQVDMFLKCKNVSIDLLIQGGQREDIKKK